VIEEENLQQGRKALCSANRAKDIIKRKIIKFERVSCTSHDVISSHDHVRGSIGSSVGIVTRVRLVGPGFESRLTQASFSFSKTSRLALGMTQHLIQFVQRSLSRVK
jgi:hypothetical protein